MGSELSFRNIPLGQCLNKVIDHRGKTPKKLGSDWVESGIQTISAKNVNGGRLVARDAIRCVASDVYKRWMNTGDVLRGDCLLVSEGATMGECMYWDEDPPVVIGQRLFGLRCNPDILNSRYLYAYMVSHEFQSEIVGRSTGTSVPGLRQTEVLKLNVRLPSLARQKFIGDTLYTLNRKIELNRRMNVTLESMARALFKSWFVDFDPVIDNALAAGNPIPEPLSARAQTRRDLGTKRKPLPKNIQKLFPDAFVFDDDFGWIPKGWEIGPITELAELNAESWTAKKHPESVEYVDLGNAKEGEINEIETYPYGEAPSRAKRVLSKDDTIVGTVRPGNRSFAFVHRNGLTGSTGFAVLTPREPHFRSFVYLCLTQDPVIQKFAQLADGAAYPAIRPNVVGEYSSALPSSDLIQEFDKAVVDDLHSIGGRLLQNETLAKLRDTLLPKLLSGELRIPDAEKLVAGSL